MKFFLSIQDGNINSVQEFFLYTSGRPSVTVKTIKKQVIKIINW